MRLFNRDELRKFVDEKKCLTCDNENYFDHAEVFEIYNSGHDTEECPTSNDENYLENDGEWEYEYTFFLPKCTYYSRCLMCDATYKHRDVKFDDDKYRSCIHYHITKHTFLKNRNKSIERSIKPLVDKFIEDIELDEFKID